MKVAVLLGTQNKKPSTRSQEGDIIAVRPANWEFGTKEKKLFLIVIVDLGNDVKEISVARQLEIADYGVNYLTLPSDTEVWPEMRAKHRYSVESSAIDSEQASLGNTPVNWSRVRDIADAYQPLTTSETEMEYTHVLKDKVQDKLVDLTDIQNIKNAIGASTVVIGP